MTETNKGKPSSWSLKFGLVLPKITENMYKIYVQMYIQYIINKRSEIVLQVAVSDFCDDQLATLAR